MLRLPEFDRGRTVPGAATLLALWIGACGPTVPVSTIPPTARAVPGSPAIPTTTPSPSSPTEFAIERIDLEFLDVVALTSTGDALYWGAGRQVWRYAPGEDGGMLLYEGGEGDLIWDIAATSDGVVFSELLERPAGTWRVAYMDGEGEPIQVDRAVAEGGAPPTVAIDAERIAWAGFDESSGTPETFLRFVDRGSLESATTLDQVDIDAGLFWYPQLDEDTLWYSVIEPDFEGTGGGDRFHIATFDLTNPSADPVPSEGLEGGFEAVVTPDHVAWKSVESGMAAQTWADIYIHDRRSGEQVLVTKQANHASVGSRFVVFEEFFREKLLLYDLATRSVIEVPDARPGARGTIGSVSIAGSLLGYSVSSRGAETVYWSVLPN